MSTLVDNLTESLNLLKMAQVKVPEDYDHLSGLIWKARIDIKEAIDEAEHP